MLITNSKDGVIVDLNHAFTNFTGFKLKDIVGKSTLEMDYITLEERAKVVSEINVNGCSENNKKEIRDKNNKIKSIIFNTFPIAEDPDSLLITYLFDMSKARLRIELHNDV